MAALDFPLNPSDGQVYSANGKSWTWNLATTSWLSITVSGSSGTSGTSGTGGGESTVVEAKNSGYTITTADVGKTFTCNSTTGQTFLLPSVGAGELGYGYTVTKLGSGRVTITAADSDTIEDSGAGLGIYCADSGIATIQLKLVSLTQWIIKSANGVWITTI